MNAHHHWSEGNPKIINSTSAPKIILSQYGTPLRIQCMAFDIDLLQESLPLQNSFRHRTNIFAHDILSFCDERESMRPAVTYYVADEPSQDKSPTVISARSSFPVQCRPARFPDKHYFLQDGEGCLRKLQISGNHVPNQFRLLVRRDQDRVSPLGWKPEDVDTCRDVPVAVANLVDPSLHMLLPDLTSQILECGHTGHLKCFLQRQVFVPRWE